MDVMQAIRERRSVRSYQDKPIEQDRLQRILEAARLAPSACNFQEWKFVVVQDKAIREKLMEAAHGQKSVGEAPVVIAACAIMTDRVMPCNQLAYPIDLAIAIDHMTLQAVEERLGTCWIGAFSEEKAKQALGIPDAVRVVALLPLGYPAQPAPKGEKSRKPLSEIVVYDKWS